MLEGLKPPVKIWPCKIRLLAETLSKDDAKILLEAVEGSEWRVNALQKALADRGLSVSDTPIHNHRNKICSCYRL